MEDHRRFIYPLPMSGFLPSKRQRKHWLNNMERPTTPSIHPFGRVISGPVPMEQTSKGGRNIKIRAYKRAKRLEQGTL